MFCRGQGVGADGTLSSTPTAASYPLPIDRQGAQVPILPEYLFLPVLATLSSRLELKTFCTYNPSDIPPAHLSPFSRNALPGQGSLSCKALSMSHPCQEVPKMPVCTKNSVHSVLDYTFGTLPVDLCPSPLEGSELPSGVIVLCSFWYYLCLAQYLAHHSCYLYVAFNWSRTPVIICLQEPVNTCVSTRDGAHADAP